MNLMVNSNKQFTYKFAILQKRNLTMDQNQFLLE